MTEGLLWPIMYAFMYFFYYYIQNLFILLTTYLLADKLHLRSFSLIFISFALTPLLKQSFSLVFLLNINLWFMDSFLATFLNSFLTYLLSFTYSYHKFFHIECFLSYFGRWVLKTIQSKQTYCFVGISIWSFLTD